MKRKIVLIDEDKCNGCGNCITNCAEGAMEIVNGKARLIKEIFCDGFGACLGHCPQEALTIEERESPDFDEEATNVHLKKLGRELIGATAHSSHNNGHGGGGCPSARVIERKVRAVNTNGADNSNAQSMLGQWPIQLTLVPPGAPFLKNADLLIAADCVPFAYPGFHEKFLKGKAVVIGCPKLDDLDFYIGRLKDIFNESNIKSITIVHMEVPCCFGLNHAVEQALNASTKDIEVEEITIGVDGEIKS